MLPCHHMLRHGQHACLDGSCSLMFVRQALSWLPFCITGKSCFPHSRRCNPSVSAARVIIHGLLQLHLNYTVAASLYCRQELLCRLKKTHPLNLPKTYQPRLKTSHQLLQQLSPRRPRYSHMTRHQQYSHMMRHHRYSHMTCHQKSSHMTRHQCQQWFQSRLRLLMKMSRR